MNRIVRCGALVFGLASCTSSSPSLPDPPEAGVQEASRAKAIRCEPEQDGVFVGTVTGRVLDASGKPATPRDGTAPFLTICGSACISGDIQPEGTFTVSPSFCYLRGGYYPVPVFIFHGEPAYANVVVDFVPRDARQVDHIAIDPTIYTVATADFAKARYDDGIPFTLSDAKGFSISAPAGAIELPFVEDKSIAAGRADLRFFPLGEGKGGESLSALYVITPANSKIDPPATVRFPNTAKLAAGRAVELLAIGSLVTANKFRPGTLGVIGTGRVSVDGTVVESVPGADSGLITTGWIGYRPAP